MSMGYMSPPQCDDGAGFHTVLKSGREASQFHFNTVYIYANYKHTHSPLGPLPVPNNPLGPPPVPHLVQLLHDLGLLLLAAIAEAEPFIELLRRREHLCDGMRRAIRCDSEVQMVLWNGESD